MTQVISGSFAEFDPEEVVWHIDEHLQHLRLTRQKEKDDWYEARKVEGKTVGSLFWKKTVPYTQQELDDYWHKGKDDGWHFHSPKYNLWDCWSTTINKFEKLKSFCQLATAAGNRTVKLSKEDAVFAYDWET